MNIVKKHSYKKFGIAVPGFRMNKKILLLILLTLATVAFFVSSTNVQKTSSNQDLAKEITEQCASADPKKNCYEKRVLALMGGPYPLSMEKAFEIVTEIQKQDKQYVYCHDMAHYISSAETKRQPEKWKDVMGKCPSGVCSNGCIHGVLQERFRAEALSEEQIRQNIPDLKTVCDKRPGWDPSPLEQSTCLHGMGHLTMYLSRGNAVEATKLCDTLLAGSQQSEAAEVLCYDGVFMTIFQPLEPTDYLLRSKKNVKKNEVFSFCDSFNTKKRASCLNEGSDMFVDEIQKPLGLHTYCSRIGKDSFLTDRCYDRLFYRLVRDYKLDQQKIISTCSRIDPEPIRAKCFRSTAVHMMETNWNSIVRAVQLCENIREQSGKEDCYEGLSDYALFGFPPGSTSSEVLCKKLPDPFRKDCLESLSRLNKN